MNKRELNDKEKGLALTMSASVHYLIRCLDDLQATSIYKQKLKLVANQFLKELENHAQTQVWSADVEGADVSRATDQMEDIANMMHNLLMISLALGEVHQAQQPLFWQEMQKQFKRFEMPLRLDPAGSLEFVLS
ncbi:hypothetical protein [Dyadobacter sandarakinus]|uniref:Phosphoribosyl-ATP pyrophosphohydrolase n=1 Tax=Dyadobacter sandarakinus TaxID=2747268 RepID=A0ABX7I116_9BACT|nr:hypothetical protein [Dyadobacter sandarakinus]QRQ99761.1 hypothetical protein HWI92_01915 [Dyadobacter sandarakinus]